MAEPIKDFGAHVAAVKRRESVVRALLDWDEGAACERLLQAADGALHGWALGVKDIIDVAGHPTRCGVEFTPETPATSDAEVVERLKSLGAYVFSKVVTTVFAYFDPGPSTNPWNPAHTTGGSSMGSAAAVAAGFVRLALGSQTVGSIGRPASYCGVVGFKPTYERMPLAGVFPFSPTVDTVGFFTQNVRDLRVASSAYFGETTSDVSTSVDATRVGLIDDMLCDPADEDMLAAVREVGARLTAEGFSVRPASVPSALRAAYDNHLKLITAEAAISHRDLFSVHSADYTPKLRELILSGQKISTAELEECRGRRVEFESEIAALWDEFDVLLTPSAPGAALRGLEITGDPRMNLIASHTRVPALTLPARLNADGLPLGVQLLAPKMADLQLLAAAETIESVIDFHARIPEA